MKLIRGDEVEIIRGKDKGRRGKIEKVFLRGNLIVEIDEFVGKKGAGKELF